GPRREVVQRRRPLGERLEHAQLGRREQVLGGHDAARGAKQRLGVDRRRCVLDRHLGHGSSSDSSLTDYRGANDKLSRVIDPRPDAWRIFVETHAALFGRLADEMREAHGMPVTWYDVLLHLAEVDGQRLRMGDLARAVVISKSGLTALVDRME